MPLTREFRKRCRRAFGLTESTGKSSGVKASNAS
jgi:hypothetical protein